MLCHIAGANAFVSLSRGATVPKRFAAAPSSIASLHAE
jgi:hypothetical protein